MERALLLGFKSRSLRSNVRLTFELQHQPHIVKCATGPRAKVHKKQHKIIESLLSDEDT